MDHYSFQTGSDMKYTKDVLNLVNAFSAEKSTPVEETLL